MKKNYKVEIDCPVCAAKAEDASKKVAGVKDLSINFITQKMSVEFEDGIDAAAAKNVMAEVAKACKKVEPDCEIVF